MLSPGRGEENFEKRIVELAMVRSSRGIGSHVCLYRRQDDSLRTQRLSKVSRHLTFASRTHPIYSSIAKLNVNHRKVYQETQDVAWRSFRLVSRNDVCRSLGTTPHLNMHMLFLCS